MATISARIDDKLKENAESVADAIGIPLSTAINIFLKKFIAVQGFPFDVVALGRIGKPSALPGEDVDRLTRAVRQAIAAPDDPCAPPCFTYFDAQARRTVKVFKQKE